MRLCLLLLAGCAVAEAQEDRTVEGKRAFGVVHRVLLHPRCMNCHPSGDAPLQYDTSVPHGQNITRRSEQNGLACSTCHRASNGKRRGEPPGAPNWHLPPVDMPMVFQGRAPKQLCEQLKDPRENGGKDLAALVHHVEHDALVHWGWKPGPGRAPVSVPHATFVAAMKTWVRAGAPCPD
jgi:hypothetical protein